MNITPLFCHNPLRNFIYVLTDPKSKTAICIDPFDSHIVQNFLEENQLNLVKIINTHEHWDHIQGNKKLKHIYNCEILSVPGVRDKDISLLGGELIQFAGVQLKVIKTPGHTENHICILAEESNSAQKLFSGDTLFNAGVGHCKNGGNPKALYQTIRNFIGSLSGDTELLPGHDYAINNLEFALNHEPNNIEIKNSLEFAKNLAKSGKFYFRTLKHERQTNPFLRLSSEEIQSRILDKNAAEEDIFIQLRKLRDSW